MAISVWRVSVMFILQLSSFSSLLQVRWFDLLISNELTLAYRPQTFLYFTPVALLYDHLLTLGNSIHMGTTKTSERDFVLRPQISGVLRGDRNPGFPLLYTTFSQSDNFVHSIFDVSSFQIIIGLHNFQTCNLYQTFINVYTLVVELIVPILLAMRVYAMYERSRHVFWALWIAFGCLLPVVVWSVVISSLGTVLLEGLVCDRFFPEQKATFLAITWGCALAFDTLIFCLIARKSIQAKKTYSDMEIQIPLMSLMVRDGLAYYGLTNADEGLSALSISPTSSFARQE
ncbi:hypothetical protein EV360DRAFT_83091 [Lentinula raphanica]|nr:hypothetical protein EV360DRAFT_83091 [Lentinula raphanica]